MAGGKQNTEKLKKALLVAVDFLGLSLQDAAPLKFAAEKITVFCNPNKREFKLKNVPSQLIPSVKELKSFRTSKKDPNDFYLSYAEAHSFYSVVMSLKDNQKEPIATPSSKFVSQPSAPPQPSRGTDSGTASTASSAQSSPAGSPGRPVSCNQRSLSGSIFGEQQNQNTLFNTLLLDYLCQLNLELNKAEWNTKGFTFFSRHVPLHIEEMRAVFLGYDVSLDNILLGNHFAGF